MSEQLLPQLTPPELAVTVPRSFVRPVLLTLSRYRGFTTVIVVVPNAPVGSVAVIVAVPALSAVASPVESIVATDVVSLDHVIATPLMATGDAEDVAVPFPSWPQLLVPQQRTPFETTAQLCCHHPALMPVAPLTPRT